MPSCGKGLAEFSNPYVCCPNPGCRFECSREELDAHFAKCEFASKDNIGSLEEVAPSLFASTTNYTVVCPNPGCEFICKLRELERHFKKCEFGWDFDDYISNRDLEQQFDVSEWIAGCMSAIALTSKGVLLHMVIVFDIQVMCPNNSRGCRVTGALPDVKAHIPNCSFKPRECSTKGKADPGLVAEGTDASNVGSAESKEAATTEEDLVVASRALQVNYEVMCVFSSYGCRHSCKLRDLPAHIVVCEWRVDFTRSKEIKVSWLLLDQRSGRVVAAFSCLGDHLVPVVTAGLELFTHVIFHGSNCRKERTTTGGQRKLSNSSAAGEWANKKRRGPQVSAPHPQPSHRKLP